MEENEDAWELYLAVRTQWRASGLGPIGLDYGAVHREAARMGIELSECTMRKLRRIEQAVLEEAAK